jgi:hypothetical protein
MQTTGDLSMTEPQKHPGASDYRIRLKGSLDHRRADWFEPMAISTDGNETILTGPVADQAALHGLLIRIRDLNLMLLSVECLKTNQPEKHDNTEKAPIKQEERNHSK